MTQLLAEAPNLTRRPPVPTSHADILALAERHMAKLAKPKRYALDSIDVSLHGETIYLPGNLPHRGRWTHITDTYVDCTNLTSVSVASVNYDLYRDEHFGLGHDVQPGGLTLDAVSHCLALIMLIAIRHLELPTEPAIASPLTKFLDIRKMHFNYPIKPSSTTYCYAEWLAGSKPRLQMGRVTLFLEDGTVVASGTLGGVLTCGTEADITVFCRRPKKSDLLATTT